MKEIINKLIHPTGYRMKKVFISLLLLGSFFYASGQNEINKIDERGFKQGRWIIQTVNSQVECGYLDNLLHGVYLSHSYGPNDVLELGMPDDKDWEGGTRSGILLHGGRQEGEYAKRTDLMSTHGCIRINDDDIAELKRITDALEKNDPEETRGYLTVSDDLDTPVTYSTDASIRRRVGLPEPVVEPEHSEDTPISILSKPNPICPADKTRVQLPYIPEL